MNQSIDFRIFKILLIFSGLFIHVAIHAQTQKGKGFLMIAVKPDKAIIRLDTMLIKQQRSHIAVDTGQHIIRAWAPGRVLVTDTLQFSENTAILFRRKLPFTEAYKEYRHKKRVYNVSKTLTRYLPGIVTVEIALNFWLQHGKAEDNAADYLVKAQASKATYESLTDATEIQEHKAWYYYYKGKYDSSIERANDISNRSKYIVPAGIVVTGVLYYLSTKLVKPVYNEQPLLSGLRLDYELVGQAPGPRLKYNIKF